jgi:C4-dicarboxylate-specific signal transduction histidine kinase
VGNRRRHSGERGGSACTGARDKTDTERVPLDVNDVVKEVTTLVQRELVSHRISLRMELAPAPPNILGDRIQLQQVINLVMNGIEAMESVATRPRELEQIPPGTGQRV